MLYFLAFLCFTGVYSYSNGAGTCSDLDIEIPNPMDEGQGDSVIMGDATSAGFGMVIDNADEVPGGQSTTVTLTGGDYTGLLMWAEDMNSNRLGRFDLPAGYQNQDCLVYGDQQLGTTITHIDASVKQGQEFTWTAPYDYQGEVYFYMYVATPTMYVLYTDKIYLVDIALVESNNTDSDSGADVPTGEYERPSSLSDSGAAFMASVFVASLVGLFHQL